MEWCGLMWSVGELIRKVRVLKTFVALIQVFDTRLKILTPAPLVVLVTNIRYAIR